MKYAFVVNVSRLKKKCEDTFGDNFFFDGELDMMWNGIAPSYCRSEQASYIDDVHRHAQ